MINIYKYMLFFSTPFVIFITKNEEFIFYLVDYFYLDFL